MNFYKNFSFFLGILLCTIIFPRFSLAANEPLSIFFISDTVEGGQLVTIKNISANHQGNWRLALIGENAEHFRINGQKADFEHVSSHYVQLPNSLDLGHEWDFFLTAQELAPGQYSVELVLWTTQGQPQHPFNGVVLGRTTLFFSVEETKGDKECSYKEEGEDAEKELPKDTLEPKEQPQLPEKAPEEQQDERPPSPANPEPELPEEAVQSPSKPDNDYSIVAATPEDNSHIDAQDQIVGRISTRQISTQNVPPLAAPTAPDIVAVIESQVQNTPQDSSATESIVPPETLNEPTSPPLAAPPSAIFRNIESSTAKEDEVEAKPPSPSQSVANPQTSDNEKFVSMILSFVGFLFSAMLFSIVKQKT